MKKIKKLKDVELAPEKQKNLIGGASYCDNSYYDVGNPDCCKEEYHNGRYEEESFEGPGDGGNCDCFCMPGDNATFGSYLGNKIANSW